MGSHVGASCIAGRVVMRAASREGCVLVHTESMRKSRCCIYTWRHRRYYASLVSLLLLSLKRDVESSYSPGLGISWTPFE